MEYLISARLTGRAPDSANRHSKSCTRRATTVPLDGLEAMLDGEYAKRFPNPIRVEPYKPTAKRSDRMVLAEVFTGSGCRRARAPTWHSTRRWSGMRAGPGGGDVPRACPAAGPDDHTETTARSKNYGSDWRADFAIDGKKTIRRDPRDMAPGVLERFNKDLETGSRDGGRGPVKMDAGMNGATVKVSRRGGRCEERVQGSEGCRSSWWRRKSGTWTERYALPPDGGPRIRRGEGGRLRDRAATARERSRRASIPTRISKEIHKQLDEYEAKGHRGETFTFSAKKYAINRGDLAVVVFVQDDKTRHVLQAGYVDLGPGGNAATTEANGSDPIVKRLFLWRRLAACLAAAPPDPVAWTVPSPVAAP